MDGVASAGYPRLRTTCKAPSFCFGANLLAPVGHVPPWLGLISIIFIGLLTFPRPPLPKPGKTCLFPVYRVRQLSDPPFLPSPISAWFFYSAILTVLNIPVHFPSSFPTLYLVSHRDLKPENLLLTDEPSTGSSSPAFGYALTGLFAIDDVLHTYISVMCADISAVIQGLSHIWCLILSFTVLYLVRPPTTPITPSYSTVTDCLCYFVIAI